MNKQYLKSVDSSLGSENMGYENILQKSLSKGCLGTLPREYDILLWNLCLILQAAERY